MVNMTLQRLALTPGLCLLLLSPASAELVILKSGQRIEGDVQEKGSGYEVKTTAGTMRTMYVNV